MFIIKEVGTHGTTQNNKNRLIIKWGVRSNSQVDEHQGNEEKGDVSVEEGKRDRQSKPILWGDVATHTRVLVSFTTTIRRRCEALANIVFDLLGTSDSLFLAEFLLSLALLHASLWTETEVDGCVS